MKDPFKILGLSQRATEADVKSAFRTLAKKYHPDLHPGDERNLEKFREINNAHDELIREFRKEKEAGEATFGFKPGYVKPDHNPQNTAKDKYRFAREAPEPERSETVSGAESRRSAEEIFGDFFSGFRAAKQKAPERQQEDLSYRLKLSLEDAAMGTKRRVQIRGGKKLDIKIPAGVEDGQQIRLRGQGIAGSEGSAGDTIITIVVKDHPYFTRHGANIHLELPVTVDEAVLGAKVSVPTVDGEVVLTIPAGSNTDSIFRLKGKGGLIRGKTGTDGQPLRADQYVSLKVILPSASDKGFAKLIKRWAGKGSYDVRKHFDTKANAA